ncbi:Hypothetical predicted protein [Scomber scombrus]|uniref:Uncharacterized protein n=1 Tax=Scomber scombrus TaxID=13677 RepID=A0AAV1PXM3_SCOSC
MMRWPCHQRLPLRKGKKGGLGDSYPYISAAPRSTDRLPHCTPGPSPSSGGINQDNSLHALNSEPATIHTNIRQDKKGGGRTSGEDNKLVNKGDRGGAFALSPSDDVIDLSLDYLECTFCDDITCQALLSIHFIHGGHESVDAESFYPTH